MLLELGFYRHWLTQLRNICNSTAHPKCFYCASQVFFRFWALGGNAEYAILLRLPSVFSFVGSWRQHKICDPTAHPQVFCRCFGRPWAAQPRVPQITPEMALKAPRPKITKHENRMMPLGTLLGGLKFWSILGGSRGLPFRR